MRLRVYRNALAISQSRLAQLARVSRFKICTFELGGGTLTEEEQARIVSALQAEAERLRNINPSVDFKPGLDDQATAGIKGPPERNPADGEEPR